MLKPKCLVKGDTVAIVSLSSGMMGEDMFIHRYNLAKERLENDFGFKVITMPSALKGIKYLKEHPEARAKDLMDAFLDKDIKAIFNAIGGEGGLEILPYIDFDIIKNNPKIFTGFSDTTSQHFMMFKAGLVSYYGLSIMDNLSEYVSINDYTLKMMDEMLLHPTHKLEIKPSEYISDEDHRVNWNINNINVKREVFLNNGYEVLQGNKVVEGQLLGGCLEILNKLIDTSLWPSLEIWRDKILLLETFAMDENTLKNVLLKLKDFGLFNVIKGIIVGRPSQKEYYESYKNIYKEVLGEFTNLPILYNVNVGHGYPIGLFGLGLTYEIDCINKTLTLKEKGTLD